MSECHQDSNSNPEAAVTELRLKLIIQEATIFDLLHENTKLKARTEELENLSETTSILKGSVDRHDNHRVTIKVDKRDKKLPGTMAAKADAARQRAIDRVELISKMAEVEVERAITAVKFDQLAKAIKQLDRADAEHESECYVMTRSALTALT